MSVAVLGLGSIGLQHARNLLSLGEQVVGFDPDPARRALLEDQGGTAVDGREQALEDADRVVIASPNAHHADDLDCALSAGSHVFIEKPLAHRTEGIAALLADAAKRGLTVFAGLNARFNPVVTAARDSLREGCLGRVYWGRLLAASYLPDWRPGRDYRTGYAADPATGGVFFDAIHEFDIARFLFGPGKTVAAAAHSTGAIDLEAEDCADAVVRHESGVQCSIHLDYLTRPRRRRFEVAGESGLLEVDVAERRLRMWHSDGRSELERVFQSTVDQEYLREMESFLACARGAAVPACDGFEALAVLEQVLSARRMSGLPS